jgi:hypothetical protein
VARSTTDVADLAACPRLFCEAREEFAIEGLLVKLVKQMDGVLLRQSVVVRANRTGQAICHLETQSPAGCHADACAVLLDFAF